MHACKVIKAGGECHHVGEHLGGAAGILRADDRGKQTAAGLGINHFAGLKLALRLGAKVREIEPRVIAKQGLRADDLRIFEERDVGVHLNVDQNLFGFKSLLDTDHAADLQAADTDLGASIKPSDPFVHGEADQVVRLSREERGLGKDEYHHQSHKSGGDEKCACAHAI